MAVHSKKFFKQNTLKNRPAHGIPFLILFFLILVLFLLFVMINGKKTMITRHQGGMP